MKDKNKEVKKRMSAPSLSPSHKHSPAAQRSIEAALSQVRQPKTKRGEQTRAKLCAVAEQLFYEHGYHRTGIKDITDAAGLGLGTFYIYFKDKLSLYVYVLSQYSHRIRMGIAQRIAGQTIKSRKEAERLGLLAFLEMVREKPHFYHIIWEALYIDKNLFIDYYVNFGRQYNRQIREAQQAGEMQLFDPEVGAFMLMGVANFIGLRYAMFDRMSDLEQIADEVIRILDAGMFAEF